MEFKLDLARLIFNLFFRLANDSFVEMKCDRWHIESSERLIQSLMIIGIIGVIIIVRERELTVRNKLDDDVFTSIFYRIFLRYRRSWVMSITSFELTIAVNAPLIVGLCQLRGMPCLESSIPDTLKWLSEPEMEGERRRSRRRLRVKSRDRENI